MMNNACAVFDPRPRMLVRPMAHDACWARGHRAPATRGSAASGGSTEAPENHGWRHELERANGIASGNKSREGAHRGVGVSRRGGGGT
jgi:hypothetical protein